MEGTAERVVADLVAAGVVEQARAPVAERVVRQALDTGPTERPPRPAGRSGLVEIAGYAGGALVLAAVGLFLAQEWPDLSDTAQVLTLAAIAALLAAAGMVVCRVGGGRAELRAGRDDVRRRLASALLSAAAVTGGVAVGRQLFAMDETSDWPYFVGPLAAMLLAKVGYAVAPSALGLLVVAATAFQSVLGGWTLVETSTDASTTLWPGLVVLALGATWLLVTELTPLIRERVVGRGIGLAFALFGAQMTMFENGEPNLAYALTTTVAVLGFVLYLRTTSWPYLVAGVLGLTVVVPEAVVDWTAGALGPAGGVLVAGLALLAASVVGLRVRHEAHE